MLLVKVIWAFLKLILERKEIKKWKEQEVQVQEELLLFPRQTKMFSINYKKERMNKHNFPKVLKCPLKDNLQNRQLMTNKVK